MPKFGYSFQVEDPLLYVRASAREVNISPKHAREICRSIKGMTIARARKLLEEVIEKKIAIPYRRYHQQVSHKSSTRGYVAGGYPIKSAEVFLRLLDNLENNASFKGMNVEKVAIVHANAYKGMTIKDYIPRAQGRSSPNFHVLVHIELVGKEVA
ncbi:MAG: 50S ribosomal protein L22 [Nitrososphaeria archaeon]